MTRSELTDVFIWTNNHYNGRSYPVTRVTVHHMAGNLTAEQCGYVFQNPSRSASSNYGIGSDGKIGMYVDEDDAAWTSSSYDNDNRAITIEVADYDCENWVPSVAAYESCVRLCADICNRYGIVPSYTGDTSGSFTEHMMFAATGCPGPWWHDKMPEFVEDVKDCMGGDYDMATPGEIWGFKNSSLEKVDAYQILRDIRDNSVKAVQIAQQALAAANAAKAAAEKACTGGVDVKAIAKAVNDDAAARMKA